MDEQTQEQTEPVGRIKRAKQWVQKNERLVTSGAFLGGFGVDLLTLNRIDQWFDNVVLLTYLSIAALAVLLINIDVEERFGWKWIERLSPFMLYVVQFAFGGLFSGFVIFYTKSASWYVAWPFLIVLYLLFLANDRIRGYYRRFEFQVAVLFTAIMALSILLVPTFLRMIGDVIFIISGIVSIGVVFVFLKFLYVLLPTITAKRRWKARRNIFFIFAVFNILYFSNIIPPIPLSLKQGDIYHNVVRDGVDSYQVTYEQHPWYRIDKRLWKNEFNKVSAEDTIYAFVSIFGPERLSANIFHQWEWFNPQTETWKEVIKPEYALTGGRDGGFRWYSFIPNPTAGEWRVRVTTLNDKEIGRISFTVINAEEPPLLGQKSI